MTKCFPKEFLSLQQFGECSAFRSKEGKLVKLCRTHPKYNNPPFSFIDPDWRLVSFHITGSNGLVVDMDDVFDPETKAVKPWAAAFLEKYTKLTAHEYSVSGKGAHLIFRVIGEIPAKLLGIHRWEGPTEDGAVDVFVNRKYVVMTGRPIGEPTLHIAEITPDQLLELMREIAAMRPIRRSGQSGIGVRPAGAPDEREYDPQMPMPQVDPRFSIEDFLEWLGIPLMRVDEIDGIRYYRLSVCPTYGMPHPHHCPTSSSIVFSGTSLGFKCHSSRCEGRGISDVMRWGSANRGTYPGVIWSDALPKPLEVIEDEPEWMGAL